MSEADDAFLHVHLDHLQSKSRSQDYVTTSGSAIWLQNSNCKEAKKMFVPRVLDKGQWLPGADKHHAWCVTCESQLICLCPWLLQWSLQNLILVLVSSYKVLIWLESTSLRTMFNKSTLNTVHFDVLSRAHGKGGKKAEWFQIWHFYWLFSRWHTGKRGSERVKPQIMV